MIKITTNNSTAATFQPPPPSSSAVEVSENHDLLTEILLYLPIKSLIKFKSVSKQWLYLISNHQFSLRRSASPASPATGLFIDASEFKGFESADANVPEFDFIDLNNPSPQHSTPPFQSLTFSRIVQSCNGLLLCSNAQNATDEATQTLYVHNPTTKQYTTLPPLPPRTAATPEAPYHHVQGVALAFDPSKSPHYKVICVTNPTSDPNEFLIDIYSSSDEVGGWRSSALGPFESCFDGLFYSGVFWNGAVHWLSPWGPSLSFDVEEELMREMPMPPVPDALEGIDRMYGYFGESGGHMHFVDHILQPGESRLNVYEMKRDCSGWFVKYSVDLSRLGAMFPEMVSKSYPDAEPLPDEYEFSVFCVVRGEVEEGSYLVINIPGKILRYNFESMACCKLCDVPMVDGMSVVEMPSAYQYIESLACV